MEENGGLRLRRLKLIYHRSATENPVTKSDLVKNIFSDSAVLAANRCIGFVAVMVLAALPAVGAGSAKQAAEAYMYRGVLHTEMGRKVDAQADVATLEKRNPQLAKDLAEVIKTGKEEDRFYGLSSKIRG